MPLLHHPHRLRNTYQVSPPRSSIATTMQTASRSAAALGTSYSHRCCRFSATRRSDAGPARAARCTAGDARRVHASGTHGCGCGPEPSSSAPAPATAPDAAQTSSSRSRRALLGSAAVLLSAAATRGGRVTGGGAAWADALTDDIASQLPGAPAPAPDLPKGMRLCLLHCDRGARQGAWRRRGPGGWLCRQPTCMPTTG